MENKADGIRKFAGAENSHWDMWRAGESQRCETLVRNLISLGSLWCLMENSPTVALDLVQTDKNLQDLEAIKSLWKSLGSPNSGVWSSMRFYLPEMRESSCVKG